MRYESHSTGLANAPDYDSPSVRLDDIETVLGLVVIIGIVGTFAMLFVFDALGFDLGQTKTSQPPQGLFLVAAIIWSSAFFIGSHILIRRKYGLPWDRIGLTWTNWRHGLLWATILLPPVFVLHRLEISLWERLFEWAHLSPPIPWGNLGEIAHQMQHTYGFVGVFEVLVSVVISMTTQGIFMWGLIYHAVQSKAVSRSGSAPVWLGVTVTALGWLVLFVASVSSGLSFFAAILATWAYQHTHTLLSPVTIGAGAWLLACFI